MQGCGRFLVFIAALAGAAGVALAAVAAHKLQNPAIASASQMLMVHAAAVLALVAIAGRHEQQGFWLAAALVILAGSIVFALAVSLPLLADVTFFPMAAPIGGTAVMVGWALAALAALVVRS